METKFTPDQLRDPRLREADEILRQCTHCGLCLPACPTYLLLGDERDGPRGRIYLIKSMLEGDSSPRQVRPYLDRCLSCLSCMTACPTGVDYLHLSGYARHIVERSALRDPRDELMRKALRETLPYPKRFRLALSASIAGRLFRSMLRWSRRRRLLAVADMAPRRSLRHENFAPPQTVKTKKARKGRVALLSGCTQRVLRPQINDATVRLLNHIGYDVTLAEGEGCCGFSLLHMGRETEAKALAGRNVDSWQAEREKGPLSAIIVNAGGCGTMVKDYARLFAHDTAYVDKAKYVSVLAKDITEFMAQQKIDSPLSWSDIRVAYHSPCSLQHGQRLDDLPRQLLRNSGFTVLDIPESDICCGGAGSYNILQPHLANQLRERKIASIERMRADCIVTGDIDCISHLSAQAIPVVHTVELLDWAYGGPCPEELKPFENRMRRLQGRAEKSGDSAAEDRGRRNRAHESQVLGS
ncbi:MAG TPA: glycolate oxidase subunit GlcF [Hyphomicrobiales bacterium]|nr:glycolate oxidase subunit GlcF [Hyphomicrobiales bacterium]